jgi:hypothetical protein
VARNYNCKPSRSQPARERRRELGWPELYCCFSDVLLSNIAQSYPKYA